MLINIKTYKQCIAKMDCRVGNPDWAVVLLHILRLEKLRTSSSYTDVSQGQSYFNWTSFP